MTVVGYCWKSTMLSSFFPTLQIPLPPRGPCQERWGLVETSTPGWTLSLRGLIPVLSPQGESNGLLLISWLHVHVHRSGMITTTQNFHLYGVLLKKNKKTERSVPVSVQREQIQFSLLRSLLPFPLCLLASPSPILYWAGFQSMCSFLIFSTLLQIASIVTWLICQQFSRHSLSPACFFSLPDAKNIYMPLLFMFYDYSS